jgi:MoaA/NifB/PqqE/SkfB family radical SAM enzyme
MAQNLRELVYFINAECNLSCRTCFYMPRKSTAAAQPQLSLGELEAAARSLGTLRALLLSGGEPFLSDSLLPVCLLFARHNPIRHVHLPTNGTLTERIFAGVETLLQKMPAVQLTVSFSLDGLAAANDAIKGRSGHFAQACESVKRLELLRRRFSNLEVQIITVVADENLADVLPLAEYVRNNLPVDGHGPSPLRGSPRDANMRPPTPQAWQRLAAQLLPYHRYWISRSRRPRWKKRLALNRVAYLYRLYGRVLAGGAWPFRCPAGRSVGVLEADGVFRHCELSAPLGNIREYRCDLAAAWRSPAARAGRLKLATCACTHACFISPGIRSSPRALLASLRG